MSYVMTNFYKNPGPVYYGSDVNEPVPGWGINPNLSEGPRVGVGQSKISISPTMASKLKSGDMTKLSEDEIPAWYYLAGAIAISGAAIAAYSIWG